MVTFIYWKLNWKMRPIGVEGKAGGTRVSPLAVRTGTEAVRPQDFRMACHPLTLQWQEVLSVGGYYLPDPLHTNWSTLHCSRVWRTVLDDWRDRAGWNWWLLRQLAPYHGKSLGRTQWEKNKADLGWEAAKGDTCMPPSTGALEPIIFPSWPWWPGSWAKFWKFFLA